MFKKPDKNDKRVKSAKCGDFIEGKGKVLKFVSYNDEGREVYELSSGERIDDYEAKERGLI